SKPASNRTTPGLTVTTSSVIRGRCCANAGRLANAKKTIAYVICHMAFDEYLRQPSTRSWSDRVSLARLFKAVTVHPPSVASRRLSPSYSLHRRQAPGPTMCPFPRIRKARSCSIAAAAEEVAPHLFLKHHMPYALVMFLSHEQCGTRCRNGSLWERNSF